MHSLLSSAVLKISKLADVVFLYLSYSKEILQTISLQGTLFVLYLMLTSLVLFKLRSDYHSLTVMMIMTI